MKDFFKDKKTFGWVLFYEIILTLSGEPSFFSVKRLERTCMFTIAMWLIVGFILRNWTSISTEQSLTIAGFLLSFGAWNTVQLRKDKQAENEKNTIPSNIS